MGRPKVAGQRECGAQDEMKGGMKIWVIGIGARRGVELGGMGWDGKGRYLVVR